MKRISWLIVLIVVFAFGLAACGGDEPEAPPAAEPTVQEEPVVEEPAVEEPVVEEPVAEEPVAEEPVVEEPAEEPMEQQVEEETPAEVEISVTDLELTSLDDLTSYRYIMLMEIIGTNSEGEEVSTSIEMEIAATTDPPAMGMLMISDGTVEAEQMGQIEFVQIDDTAYINMGEMGCMTLPADDNNAPSTDEMIEGFTPESITEDLENITFVGEETIGNVDVLHYTYDDASVMAEAATDIESLEGHIYIAKDGGYMVRSVVDVVGNSAFTDGFPTDEFQSETAVTHIEMTLTDVNENVVITPPATCADQSAPENVDWPMMDDASEVSSFAGILSYSTAASGNDAIEFYTNAMAEMGYTLDDASSFVTDGNGLLTFTNADGESVSVTISEDTAAGVTTVTVLADMDF